MSLEAQIGEEDVRNFRNNKRINCRVPRRQDTSAERPTEVVKGYRSRCSGGGRWLIHRQGMSLAPYWMDRSTLVVV